MCILFKAIYLIWPARIVKRKLLRESPLDNSVPNFCIDIVSRIIRNSGNPCAVGPKDLTTHYLKHSNKPKPYFQPLGRPLQQPCYLETLNNNLNL